MNNVAASSRRWYQISIRSLFAITFLVAVWLGCEVREGRRLERALAGLQAIGGNGECEASGLSLLRLWRVPGYGLRIVRIEIPGDAAEAAVDLMGELPTPREVRVNYDGTYDPTPSWEIVKAQFPQATVIARSDSPEKILDTELLDDDKWRTSTTGRRLTRFRATIIEAYPEVSDRMVPHLESLDTRVFQPIRYQLRVLPEGVLAEIFVREQVAVSTPGGQRSLVVLLVSGRCVGVKGFVTSSLGARQRLVFADFDHSGLPQVGFDAGMRATDSRVRKVDEDRRYWLGVYKIERSGFRSLLPEDLSDFP